MPSATPKVENTIDHQWTIDTGEISGLGVAQDGTIYGLTYFVGRAALKYVQISSEGKIIQIIDMPPST